MNYRYKVKGIAKKPFVLRAMAYRIGCDIDMAIFESELDFVKENCTLDKIEDFLAPQNPIPTNSKTVQRGVKNELPKSTSGTIKVKNTPKV